ncbi:MAG TPA: DUF47 family protein [Jiangellales bacterium]|nr:DUF47 family protein [Jiangellales bacterium]
MRLRFTPVDTAFFDLFTASAENIREGVRLLAEALPETADRAAYATKLRDIEHLGDEATHEIIKRVNSTFVTPLDREDIYGLASGLDDVMDDVEAAVDLMVLYRVGALPSEVEALVDVLSRCADLTVAAMPRLRTMGDLHDYWIEVNRLENEADRVYRRLLARIFSGEFDALTVHKLKDVVDVLEAAVDGFERVANTIEQIAIKES